MPLIFTDEYIDSVSVSHWPFEGRYIKRLATDEKMGYLRKKIEDILVDYPEAKKDRMIDAIKFLSDLECRASLSELFVFGRLIKYFSNVEVEIPLDFLDNKTPDFWVENEIAFEVVSLFETTSPIEDSIIETLNSIRSRVKIMLDSIKNLPEDRLPKLKEIRNYFENLLNQNQSLSKPIEFIHQFSQGIVISGKLYKGEIAHSTVGAKINSALVTPYNKSVRGRIREKIRKYKKLKTNGFPFIVVLYSYNDWLDVEDFDEILLGDMEYSVNSRTAKIQNVNRKNAIFNPKRNTSLSAVLIKDHSMDDEYFLIENPHAAIKLDKYKDRIRKAFKTRELPN